MPRYLVEEGAVAKFLTDEERKEKGFCLGNCIDASIDTWKELTGKFGNHFDIVYIIMDRRSATLTRLMNEEERKEFLNHGIFQGHFVVFNRKTRMYIDKSNGQSILCNERQYLPSFNEDRNRFCGVYHFDIKFMYNLQCEGISSGSNIVKWSKNPVGEFMVSLLKNYENRLPTKNEETRWKKKGMRIIKKYPF